jgi:DNA/RNA endonuclease G (NUC1)
MLANKLDQNVNDQNKHLNNMQISVDEIEERMDFHTKKFDLE